MLLLVLFSNSPKDISRLTIPRSIRCDKGLVSDVAGFPSLAAISDILCTPAPITSSRGRKETAGAMENRMLSRWQQSMHQELKGHGFLYIYL